MIWKRYIFKEIIKVFALFLCSFFLVYSLIDYSTHMQDFIQNKEIQIHDIFIYYAHQFIKRANLLIPLALLIATIKVLTTFNTHRELLALQAAGISLKKLLRPFFSVALFCSLFNFLCSELLLPASLNYTDQFRNAHFKQPQTGKKERIPVVTLKDGSKLFYQYYDASRHLFFDVVWVRSLDDIWHIKFLNPGPPHPVGRFVDHFTRNADGLMGKTDSFEAYPLEQLKWKRDLLSQGSVPNENKKISQLFRLLLDRKKVSSYERAEIFTQFYFKCLMPLLPFLVVLASAPYCTQYSRKMKTFFLYTAALFSFIAFFTLMNALVIIGENEVITPFLAVFAPFAISTCFFSWKFSRNC